jgi:hypothetical protein
LRVTSAMSAPGEIVSSAATPRNASSWDSIGRERTPAGMLPDVRSPRRGTGLHGIGSRA